MRSTAKPPQALAVHRNPSRRTAMTTIPSNPLLRAALLIDAAGSGALALLQLVATDALRR